MGETPLLTKAQRSAKHEIRIVKEGYIEETRSTSKGTNSWFVGNIILGGIIGVIIDLSTGAAYSVKPKEINVNLIKNEGAIEPSPKKQSENKAAKVVKNRVVRRDLKQPSPPKVKRIIRPEVHREMEKPLVAKRVKFVNDPKTGEPLVVLADPEAADQQDEAKQIEEDFIKTLKMES